MNIPSSLTMKEIDTCCTMVTDTARRKKTDPGNPEVCPVYITFHKLYSNEETLKWVQNGCTKAEFGCIECKNSVIPKVLERLAPVREKRAELEKDRSLVMDIIKRDTDKARAVAVETMEVVREKLGLGN